MARDERVQAREEAHKLKTCFNCQLREKAEWSALSPEDLGALNKAKTCHTYQPGQILFYQGNPCLGLFCVESGTVALRKVDPNGNSQLVRLVHEGQTLGYRSFFSGGPYTARAEALAPCLVCFVDRATVRSLLDRNPALGLAFLKRMAEDLYEAEESSFRKSSLPVRARLVHLLLALKDHYGTMSPDGTWNIRLPLARQDMAAMLGIRPETMTRTSRELERDGVVRFEAHSVILPDLDVLLDEIEFVERDGNAEGS